MNSSASIAASNAERVSIALRQLHDIVEPAAPPLMPPAIGWYFLALALSLLLAMALRWCWRRWQSKAYLRQALSELATLRENDSSIAALAALLRRVALQGARREKIASLSGDAWADYLRKNSALTLTPNVATLLCHAPYAKFPSSNAADFDAAFAYVGQWIKQHRVERVSAS